MENINLPLGKINIDIYNLLTDKKISSDTAEILNYKQTQYRIKIYKAIVYPIEFKSKEIGDLLEGSQRHIVFSSYQIINNSKDIRRSSSDVYPNTYIDLICICKRFEPEDCDKPIAEIYIDKNLVKLIEKAIYPDIIINSDNIKNNEKIRIPMNTHFGNIYEKDPFYPKNFLENGGKKIWEIPKNINTIILDARFKFTLKFMQCIPDNIYECSNIDHNKAWVLTVDLMNGIYISL